MDDNTPDDPREEADETPLSKEDRDRADTLSFLEESTSLIQGEEQHERILLGKSVDAYLNGGESTKQANAKTLKKNAASLKLTMSILGCQARYNTRAAHIEFKTELDSKWVQGTDRFCADLRDKIADNFTYEVPNQGKQPFRFSAQGFDETLNAIVFHAEVDPFIEWLENLPAWDETYRIDEYLSDIFGISKTEISLWVSQFLFLGPIQRAYKPGAKLDEMPVLVGSQGIGKSALLRSILPPEFPEFFADNLDLAGDKKQRIETLQGRVLVEASEMAGSTRAELQSLKAFATAQDDGTVRLAYRRNPEDSPRRCVIIGTADRDNCLPNDPAGLRRFVPVNLGGSAAFAIETFMDENRVQLWAESLDRYHSGIRAGLPRDLKLEAAEVAEKFRNRDEILEDAVQSITLKSGTLEEIAQLLGIDNHQKLDMRITKRLSAALLNAGWGKTRVRVDGKQKRIFVSPVP